MACLGGWCCERVPVGPKTHGPVARLAETDLTAVVAIDGLSPGGEHAYRVLVDGREVPLSATAVLWGPAAVGGFGVVSGLVGRGKFGLDGGDAGPEDGRRADGAGLPAGGGCG